MGVRVPPPAPRAERNRVARQRAATEWTQGSLRRRKKGRAADAGDRDQRRGPETGIQGSNRRRRNRREDGRAADGARQHGESARFPPRQGAVANPQAAFRQVRPGRDPGAGGQRQLEPGAQRTRPAPGHAAQDRDYRLRRGQGPRIHDGAGAAPGHRAHGFLQNPARAQQHRGRGKRGPGDDRGPGQGAQEDQAARGAAQDAERRHPGDRFLGHGRWRGLPRHGGRGPPPGAGLKQLRRGLRGPAHRRRDRRDP